MSAEWEGRAKLEIKGADNATLTFSLTLGVTQSLQKEEGVPDSGPPILDRQITTVMEEKQY